jgi:hypothetical protein
MITPSYRPFTGRPRPHHICGFYSDEEQRDRMLVPFIKEGLAIGDRCIVALDGAEAGGLLAQLGPAEQINSWLGAGQLDVQLAKFVCPPERVSLSDMIATWEPLVRSARSRGGRARVCGEASWWLHKASQNELVYYEYHLNQVMSHELSAFCLYDTRNFAPDVLVEMLRVHPFVYINSKVFNNPLHQQDDTAPDPAKYPIDDDQIAQLLGLDHSC